MNTVWRNLAKCNHCNKIIGDAKFSTKFFVPVCPNCGEDNSTHEVTAREVYKGKWYNPFSWLNFGWEELK